VFHVFLFDILGISVKIGTHTVYKVIMKYMTCLYFHVITVHFRQESVIPFNVHPPPPYEVWPQSCSRGVKPVGILWSLGFFWGVRENFWGGLVLALWCVFPSINILLTSSTGEECVDIIRWNRPKLVATVSDRMQCNSRQCTELERH
jgi:hypothetical protein